MIVLMVALPNDERVSLADPWLKPYRQKLQRRLAYTKKYADRILGEMSLHDFARGHDHFGLHKTADGWVFRDWAPNATKAYLIGEFSDWNDDENFALQRRDNGEWEIHVPIDALRHGDHYKLHMYWDGGDSHRVPAWATYVEQDSGTKLFDAVVWDPSHTYKWNDARFKPAEEPLLVYEAHVGMSGEKAEVSTYTDFIREIIPRVKASGYNTLQLMAIAEHPYYGSFGYHVSSIFAPSSRFGSPDDLRALVDAAHQAGLRVIMDIVHSHAVKNENEGISRYDGSLNQFFHEGDRGNHEQWDSRVFDYGKSEVAHFLLSNCRYWIDEFHIDGFRFDGVTSMLYTHHGMGREFNHYDAYFKDVDQDALAYLTLANQLIHEVKLGAVTVAEDMSAMPGIAAPVADGGIGFDYRLSMGVPDLWIEHTKDIPDEQWNVSRLFHELVQHRPEEQTISYAESHDQALVGDKTLLFRLIDKEIYDHMQKDDDNLVVSRGMALHKMIRLLTASLHHGGYLNFMGNEFGHPEWIDFPREGNDWSYHYARRQWSLRDNKDLKYQYLADFDRVMVKLIHLLHGEPENVTTNDGDHVIAFVRDGFLFAYNFHPVNSFTDYGLSVPDGEYSLIMSTDSKSFGGFGHIDAGMSYPTEGGMIKLYLPARTAVVLKKI